MELSQVTAWPVKAKTYIGEVEAEMKRVTWPSWGQVRSTTVVVIAAVFIFAAYFEVVDLLVNGAVTKIINYFTK